MSIRVVIADDQGMVRAGLSSLLSGEPDVVVVGEAADGVQAIAVIRRERPDVALMDIRMPVLDGLAATRRLVAESSTTRIVILTTFDLDEYVFEALRAGANGFVLKDASAEDLVDAVRVAAKGDAILSPSITRRVIEAFATAGTPRKEARNALAALSDREADVLKLVAAGLTNTEIANTLVISVATVKSHVANILLKLALRDRVQAAIFAYESGLVRVGTATGRSDTDQHL